MSTSFTLNGKYDKINKRGENMGYLILIVIIIIIILEKYVNKKEENIPNTNLYNETKEINTEAYEKKEYLLTKNELKFYKQLKKITDKYNLTIFAQVSLYQIIKNKEYKDFNKIKSKSIDFVITESNGKIKICIELDDKSHNNNNRKERDNFINTIFRQANIKLLRIPVQEFYNLEELEKKITEK